MTALVRAGAYVVEAHANFGAWAARCGLCPNGTPFRDAPGYLRPGTPAWECWLCGTTTEVIWPTAEMMAGVERILMMRPDPTKRNWWPGETLHDLIWENAEHGLLSPEYLGIDPPSGTPMFIVDDASIRLDRLPVLEKPRVRLELGGG